MIKLDLYFLLGVITLSGHFVAADRTCKPIDACSCKFTDTNKVVSLHAIDNGSPPPPRFNNISQLGQPHLTFDYNPCTPFNSPDGGCTNQLVCQYWDGTNAYSVAGSKSLNIPSVKNNQVIFKYTGELKERKIRHVEITLECDSSKSTPEMTNPQQQTPHDPTNLVYKFTVKTKCACEGVCSINDSPADTKKLSIGTILCIVLLVLVVVYIVGGMVFLKYYKKNEGTEVIPNRDFWTDFPSKVKDGCKFTYSKIKRKNEYESI